MEVRTAVTNVIVQMHNGRQSVTWTLITHNLVGIRVTASDPSYSGTWADQDMWSRGSHWDEITVTEGLLYPLKRSDTTEGRKEKAD